MDKPVTVAQDQRTRTFQDQPEGSPAISVEISNTQDLLSVDRLALSKLVERTLRGEGIRLAAISLTLVDNATIQRINQRHLAHGWPTDVISFRLSEPDEPVLNGELIVSAEMARTTAMEAGVDPWAELALYVVHGLLHLCGYDDGCDETVRAMRAREDEVLAREGLVNTFRLNRSDAAGGQGNGA